MILNVLLSTLKCKLTNFASICNTTEKNEKPLQLKRLKDE